VLFSAALPSFLDAATGEEAWLRYARLDPQAAQQYATLPSAIVCHCDSEILNSSRGELVRGLRSILDRAVRVETENSNQPAAPLALARECRSSLARPAHWR
jgi:alpha-glucuronidase